MAETDYAIIKVPLDCIPASGRLIEAYETESEIIVCGDPPPEPEGLSEAEYAAWYETAHNCDAMGCGTLSHVIYRFPKDAAPLEVATQALRDILDPVGRMRRNVPEGYTFDGYFAVRYADSPQCYKDIAREALEKMGVTDPPPPDRVAC